MVRDPLIGVTGWYGKGNVGDESYKLSFPKLFPGAGFVFADGPVPAVHATILGGGDVVTPENLTRLKRSAGRKFVMSVAISQDLPREAFDGVEAVVVRDIASIQRLKKSGVSATLSPDFAFALTPDPLRGSAWIEKEFREQSLDLYQRRVAVVVNAHLLYPPTARQHAAFEKLAYDLAQVADTTSASFIFIPFGTRYPWDDRTTNSWSAARAKFHKKNLTVYGPLDAQLALDVLSTCDAVVSTRLHASIFATVAGVPFVDIVHNHKNPQFLESVGLTDWAIPFHAFDVERCRDLLLAHLSGEEAKARVAVVGEAQKVLLRKAVADVHLR